MVQYYEQDVLIRELKFDMATFWVQVHNIPVRFVNHEVVDGICEIIGRVFRFTKDADYEGGGFMRIRVKLNTTQPLCKGNVITMEDGEQFWALFKYDRLLNMCYWCGCFDHTC